MRIPEDKISEISDKSDIVDLVSQYVRLEKKGDRYWGLCPFHAEKTPSFSVTPERNLFYCFGCQKGGTVFSFLQEVENVSFVEAVEMLAERVGISLNVNDDSVRDRERDALLDLYKRVSNSLNYLLTENSVGNEGREYLQKRGILDAIESFQLGFAPFDRRWLHSFLKKKHYSDEFLQKSGLFSRRNPDISLFSGRIMFPIRNRRGDVIAFGGRALHQGERIPKYINSPETKLFKKGENAYGLFENMKAIRKKGMFALVEGYIDVIALNLAGIDIGVAPLGTAFTEQQAKLLGRNADKCLLMFDGDDAGFEATRKAVSVCMHANIEPEIVELPSSADPADIAQKDGGEALQKLLKYPINSIEYLLSGFIRRHGIETPAQKEYVFSLMIPILNATDSAIRREAYIDAISETLGIDQKAIHEDLNRIEIGDAYRNRYNNRRSRSNTQTIEKTTDHRKDAKLSFDLYLMVAVTVNREFFSYVRRYINTDDLIDIRAREVYIALEGCFRNEEDSLQAVFNRIDDRELADLLASKAALDEFTVNPEAVVKSTVREIRMRKIQIQMKRTVEELKRLEIKAEDDSKLKELQIDMVHYTQELAKLRDDTYDGN
jgi:DNA primase